MVVSLIVAVSENNVIGVDGGLPWHLPKDMKFFRQATEGHHVIMGRKNYESIPEKYRPLPNRTNIIITRNKHYKAPGCIVVNDIAKAIDMAEKAGDNEPFIIGGGEIYRQAVAQNLFTRLYITSVKTTINGQVFFPDINMEEWKLISQEYYYSDQHHVHDFTISVYERH